MAAVDTRYRSPGSTSGLSRLAMMQERMRENIQQEKESKMLEMVARREAERDDIISRVTKTSISSLSSSMNSLSFSNAGQGRVRKMLEERRHNPNKGYASPKGYDKSYPLEPVSKEAGGRPPGRGVVANGRVAGINGSKRNGGDPSMIRSRSQATLQRNAQRPTRLSNSTRSFEGITTANNYHKSTSSLLDRRSSPVGTPSSTRSSPGHRRPNGGTTSFASTVGKAAPPIKPANVPKPPPRRYGLAGKAVNGNTNAPDPKPKQVISRNVLPKKAAPAPTPITKARTPLPKPAPKQSSNKVSTEVVQARKNDGMPSCTNCGRTFAADRLEKHQQICLKSKIKAKKRKVFDPTKMRTEGTEAEKYIKRGDHMKAMPTKKKADWRKKHNELIQTLRAAKGMKGYVAPPVDTTDYIQCPHCGRKFSEAAADRHIPKCASIVSNKKRR